MIYHVTTNINWANAQKEGNYVAPSLLSEGFIHTSTLEQVAGVLERYYRNVKDLLLLFIDESKLTSPLKYELAPSVNDIFPHVYGPINLDAVIKTQLL